MVNQQYDTEASMSFYRTVMGGGGDSVHYGIFHRGDEDLQQASANTIQLLAELARRVTPLGSAQKSKV